MSMLTYYQAKILSKLVHPKVRHRNGASGFLQLIALQQLIQQP
jgi:hypothetical protein